MSKIQDKKVTVSIDQSLITLVDGYVQNHPQTSRSAIFEEALTIWYKNLLEQADVDYYSSLTKEEKSSNKSWSKVTTQAAKHIWK